MRFRLNEWILSFQCLISTLILFLFCPHRPSPVIANHHHSNNTGNNLRLFMASFTNLIVNPPQNLCSTARLDILSSHYNPKLPSLFPKRPKTAFTSPGTPRAFITKATAATSKAKKGGGGDKKSVQEDKVQQVHTVEEFEAALLAAKEKLVVVEYAASHSKESSKIYPFMVNLSRTCSDVVFLLVMGDESEETQELCRREKIEKVPHFSFYKSMEKIHEEEGIGPDMLMGDVLYYGDNHSGVVSTSHLAY